MAAPADDTDDSGVDREADPELTEEVSSDERTWGILVHAAAFAGLLVPFGNILGPLVLWAIKRDDSEFVDANGKQAVNFQITWTVLVIVAALTVVIGIGVVILPLVAIVWLVLVVLAIVRTSENQVYEYPLTLEVLS